MREFGWSPDVADKAETERRDEIMLHLKIFELENERQEKENMRAAQ